MKTGLSTEVKVNAALSAFALAAGLAFLSGATGSGFVNSSSTHDVLDVAAVLDTAAPGAVETVEFLPPVDHREPHYIDLRHSASGLSDGEVLTRYKENWNALATFKSATGGLGLPKLIAQDKAMPMHALWREIQQRGLASRVLAPEFETIWTFLVTDMDAHDI